MIEKVNRKRLFVPAALLTLFFCAGHASAGAAPRLNGGEKWRVGYLEGGPYSEYTDTMRTLVEGLMELGWVPKLQLPDVSHETPMPYWDWLGKRGGAYLSFDKEDAYSAGWDDDRRASIRKTLLDRLKRGELDLVLAMGTWAGQDLANDEHSVPTMVLSTSDPVKAGIVKSPENSGRDHVTARMDPNRYLRQLRMFHRIAGFRKLGLAFENTPEGRLYSAVDKVYQVAGERGFEVVSCEVTDSVSDMEVSDRSCLECYRKLAREADAVYVTALTCVDRRAEEIAEIFKSAGIPSFSMVGSKFVRQGIMLSISSDTGYAALGKYNAGKLGEILNGTKPSALAQVFVDPLAVAVNMETVEEIGFAMPASIVRIAAEIYGK